MPERPTYDGFSKTCLLDPEQLRDRTDVLFREATEVVNDASEFNGKAAWAGTVAAGVLDDAGDLLMVNGPEGWRLPASPVRAGDDWAAVARRRVAQKTGLAVELGRPVRVTRTSYRLSGSPRRQTACHEVVFRAAPTDDPTPMDQLQRKRASEAGDDWAHDWFGALPDGAADDEFREDAAALVGE